MYGKFAREVQVKCGTITPNAWSLAGLHKPGNRTCSTALPLDRKYSTNLAHCVDLPQRSHPSNATKAPLHFTSPFMVELLNKKRRDLLSISSALIEEYLKVLNKFQFGAKNQKFTWMLWACPQPRPRAIYRACHSVVCTLCSILQPIIQPVIPAPRSTGY